MIRMLGAIVDADERAEELVRALEASLAERRPYDRSLANFR
jgi:hypothetical protein